MTSFPEETCEKSPKPSSLSQLGRRSRAMKQGPSSPGRLEESTKERPSSANPTSRKKRRRCGVCGPCLTKINCESCSNCLNRKTGHQICKYRKCIELRKKTAVNETSLPADHEIGTTSHEERRSDSNNPSPTNTVSQSDCVATETSVKEAAKDVASRSPVARPSEVTSGLPSLDEPSEPSSVRGASVTKDEANFNRGCSCKVAKDEGSVYKHLGVGSSVVSVREMLAKRLSINSEAIRIEQVGLSDKEGKNPQGCPIAKWVLRRESDNEKVLTVVRHRPGHTCDYAVVVLCIVLWEGIPKERADQLYTDLTDTLNKHAIPTARRCSTNDSKQCACQGTDPDSCGASFSFGCAWNMYHNGCKFARSKTPRKFRLQTQEKEDFIDGLLQRLATDIGHTYRNLTPEAFENQTRRGKDGVECRIGYSENSQNDDRPFSGITCCVDFCAHNHRDKHNMDNGATVILTLLGKQDSEEDGKNQQLHTLPCYHLLEHNGNVAPRNYVIPKHILTSPMAPSPPHDVNTFSSPQSRSENGIMPDEDREHTPEQQFPRCYLPGEQTAVGWKNTDVLANGSDRRPHEFHDMFLPEGNLPGYPNVWSHCASAYGANGATLPPPGFFMNGFHANGFTSNGFLQNGVIPNHHHPSVSDENRLPSNGETTDEETGPKASDGDVSKEDVTWIDDAMGGVGLALSHGSILVECAKQETHATTRIKNPNRKSPTRISLVFYQHKQLNLRNHGSEEYRRKLEQKKVDAQQAALATSQEDYNILPEGYLAMLAEAALSYPKQRLTQLDSTTAGAREVTADGSVNGVSTSPCNGFSDHTTPSTAASNTVIPLQSNPQDACDVTRDRRPDDGILQDSVRTPFPLSDYLRSLKHKETISNGFNESVPPGYPTYPYTNNLSLASFMNPMFTTPPRHPNHVFNPFTAAGRGSYEPLNSHHLDQKPSAGSQSANSFSVEALLGKKRSHANSSRDFHENHEGSARDSYDSHKSSSQNVIRNPGGTFVRDNQYGTSLRDVTRSHECSSRDVARTQGSSSRDASRVSHESFSRDIPEPYECKRRKVEHSNGWANYSSFPSHLLGLPFYPDVTLNPSKFLRYAPFAPKAIFTGTTTHGIDSLVTMAPFTGTFITGNYQW